MFPSTKALLVFAGRFLLVFFLILPLWFVITPYYNRLLAAGANVLLAVTETPRIHNLVGWDRDIVIMSADSPLTKGMKVQGFTGYLTHFNLILMSGLVLAQRQVMWKRRCTILAIALGVLFVTHVVYLVVGINFFEQPKLEAFQSTTGRLYVWGVNFYLSIAAQLVPVAIWMVLYRTFGEMPGKARAADTENTPRQKGNKRVGVRKGSRAP